MPTAGPALVFEAAEQGSVVMAQLTGVINEDNSLDERLTSTKGKGVLIDLANVERINSCGVRDWIRFAQRLEAAGNALYLLRCSPVVVAQLNMVRNFCGEKGQVVSFQAPYFCPNCDEERTETFPAAKVSVGTSPDAVCPTCKGPMEFDDLPDLYFAFAKIHGPRSVPPEIESAMANFRTAPVPNPATPAPSGSRTAPSGVRPAAAAPGSSPSNPALRVAAAPGSSPSNPALRVAPPPSAAPPPMPAAAAPPTRPSNPALRPLAPSAVPAPAAAPVAASTAQAPSAVRRPSSPGMAPLQAPGGAPTPPGLPPRASGPKPAARPLMGGSPFPTRSSGLKPAVPPPASAAGTGTGGDPTKK